MGVVCLIVLVLVVTSSGKNLDVDLLTEYLERTIQKLDKPINKNLYTRDTTDVEAYLSRERPPELGLAVADMDLDVAVDQAYQSLVGYMTEAGVTEVNCIQAATVAGTLEFVVTRNLLPVRIDLMAQVGRALLVAAVSHSQVTGVPTHTHTDIQQITDQVHTMAANILHTMGISETDMSQITKSLLDMFPTLDESTTGDNILAAIITPIANVMESRATRPCDVTMVQDKVKELRNGIGESVADMANIEKIHARYSIDASLAEAVSDVIRSVIHVDTSHGPLVHLVSAGPSNLGVTMTKTMIRAILGLAKVRIAEVAEVDQLLAASGILVPLDTLAQDVIISDIIKMGVATTSKVQAVFGFTCEAARLASNIAGMMEVQRLSFGPQSPRIVWMIKLVENMVVEMTSEDSDDVEYEVERELTSLLDKVFMEVILPATWQIDNLNGGRVYATRLLPMLYRSIFTVSRPDTMADLNRMVLVPAVKAFKEDISCPVEPTIPGIIGILESTLTDMDIQVTRLMRLVATNLSVKYSLTGDQTADVTTVMAALGKLLVTDMGEELISILTQTEIDQSVDKLNEILGIKVGEHVYDVVWNNNLHNTLLKFMPDE